MDLSEEEKTKFMSLVAKNTTHSNVERFFKTFSDVSYVCVSIDEKRKAIACLSFAYNSWFNTGSYIISLSCGVDALPFILSIINKISHKMRMIYSNDTYIVYSSDRIKNADIIVARYTDNIYEAWLITPGYNYSLSAPNADICDEFLEYICSDDDNKHKLLREYALRPEIFSKEIRNKIKLIYNSLSDSDKLLLELGEKI